MPKGKASQAKTASKDRPAKNPASSFAWQDTLGDQLSAAGLRIKTVTADGNCFFRAVADQLQGESGDHFALRGRVVSFMRQHFDDFAPFIEEDEGFQHYCKRMAKEGTWAGQQEQVALARLERIRICIHQAGQPLWTIAPCVPDFPKDAPLIHLSYHDGEHYNSVREASDFGRGPPRELSLGTKPTSGTAAAQRRKSWGILEVQLVKQGTGCDDSGPVEWALNMTEGQVDEAIEKLIERRAEELEPCPSTAEPVSLQSSLFDDSPSSALQDQSFSQNLAAADPSSSFMPQPAQPEVAMHVSPEQDLSSSASVDRKFAASASDGQQILPGEYVVGDTLTSKQACSTAQEEQKDVGEHPKARRPARNKPCPCGSGRRYKTCCLPAKAAASRRGESTGEGEMPAEDIHQMATLYI
ncbi:hypothetical protein WJX74_004441 [Apatococcus lobatus]|uniref:OTU domain-containing protein n=1 Tax=Apatococcus lobatus TaxID=904363 RepID=A0AAW1RBP4_9CHLO